MSNKDDYVLVRIRASQRVHYDQTVEMRRAQWEQIKSTPRGGLVVEDDGALTLWIDPNDIHRVEDFDTGFEMEVVDDGGQPVKPPDKYAGGAKGKPKGKPKRTRTGGTSP